MTITGELNMYDIRGQMRVSGFTLIELLLTCALSALMICFAVPSYQAQKVSSYRKLAQVELSALVLQVEALKSTQVSGQLDEAIDVETLVHHSELLSRYDFVLSPNPIGVAASYALIASPKASQSGDGGLSLSHLGEGCWHKGHDSPSVSYCAGVSW